MAVPLTDLKGKVSVITGGATGIGLATALELAAAGDAKIVIASTNAQRLEVGAATIREAGAQCLPVVCDVSKFDDVKNLYTATIEHFGTVDIVIANAGVTTSGAYLDHRPEDWDWIWGVNLLGVGYLVQAFYPLLCKQKRGQLVFIGSQVGMNPTWFVEHGPYAAAKAGVMALGAALRPEAAEHNVGVTSVILAGAATDIMSSENSRPKQYGGSLDLKLTKPREARLISAEEAGRKIVRGIMENKEWVATHPELKQMQKEYFDRILAAYDD